MRRQVGFTSGGRACLSCAFPFFDATSKSASEGDSQTTAASLCNEFSSPLSLSLALGRRSVGKGVAEN